MDLKRFFYRFFLLVLPLALLNSGCFRFVVKGDRPDNETTQAQQQQGKAVAPAADVHVVIKGETLFSIAWENGHDYRDVAHWNAIRPPYTIYPGQNLRLVAPAQPAQKKSAPGTSKKPVTQRKKTSPVNSNGYGHTKTVSWQWPAQGKLVGTYSSRDVSRRGIDISGKKGQAIYAAADGMVVYSGNGLRGYGNLVIIKHTDTLFSAYAHNDRILVRDKEKVKSGHRIADMGNTGADGYLLHFEIRRNGKPVDPLNYLPKRR